MPIYGYACNDCSHTLDALQKLSDDVLLECPECGKPALKRLLSAPRFRLKGKGWYETDFKKDNQRNISNSDTSPDSKTSTDKSAGSDNKNNTDKSAAKSAGPDSKKSTDQSAAPAKSAASGEKAKK